MTFMDRPRTAEECLFHWPTVLRLATDEWAKGFAASIAKQSQRPRWQPTDKQLSLMRRMVGELFSHPVHRPDGDDVQLIEGA